jgi:hypothetical protein
MAPEHVLPHGQRAGDTEQRFGGDERNRGQVKVPESRVANPAPVQQGAEPDEDQPADDEDRYAEVSDKKRVSQQGSCLWVSWDR